MGMGKSRLEAFSDGVIAIIITIMVLEMKVPHEASLAALWLIYPVFVSYILSFVYTGIYWNNHHHMLHAVQKINGPVLWANLHLLFWLSLIPFATGWMGENHFSEVPVALYGVVLMMAGVAYYILSNTLIKLHGKESALAKAVGNDVKGKLSVIAYALAIPLTFVNRWIGLGLYVVVAIMWLIPDRRIEKVISS
ncbi:Integral membrane protein [Collimonas arenae]|uniref:Integral membrane protein n=2 Tax=Collimonas arenae TaxID=279058 RepID=A0A0A1FHB1_9BURK|nr:Integral membrane protein [Collimonas arenae]